MNVNSLFNIIIRTVIRQLVNRGIRGGMARMGRGKTADSVDNTPSEADRDQATRARTTAKNARRSMRATRRVNRF